MKSVNFLLASNHSLLKDDVLDALNREHQEAVVETGDERNWPNVLERLREEQPEILMLELGPMLARLGDALREIKSVAPRTKVVALHTDSNSESILAAMRSGAHEFVHPPFDKNLGPALERISALETGGHEQRRGKVVGFLSAKGGCGATTIACHIAADLHRQTKKKILLGDLDLVSGMVGFAMKVQPTYSIVDALQNLSRLDESLWRALVIEAKKDFDVIPAPRLYMHGESLVKEELLELIRFMRSQHDWVVLDLGRSLNEIASDIYEELDQLILVSVLEVTALHGLKTIVRLLTERGENLDTLQLVINRTPKMMDMSTEELAKMLGRPLFAMLPNDYQSLYQAYSNGTLLPPENRLAQQFSQLTTKIAGLQVASAKKKKFRLFG